MTSVTAAPPAVVDIVRSTDGRIHIAHHVATVTDCGLVDVEIDTTVNIDSFEEADEASYCRLCFRRSGDGDLR